MDPLNEAPQHSKGASVAGCNAISQTAPPRLDRRLEAVEDLWKTARGSTRRVVAEVVAVAARELDEKELSCYSAVS